jgi:hypothetical protein
MDDAQSAPVEDQNKEPLTYEETPVIEPVISQDEGIHMQDEMPEAAPAQDTQDVPPTSMPPADMPPAPTTAPLPPVEDVPPPSPKTPPSRGFFSRLVSALGTLLFFIILFGVGVWLSGIIRNYVSTPIETGSPTPTPTTTESVVPAGGATPSAQAVVSTWTRYGVISGVTRREIAGVSYELPPEVLAPACDGATCASQGTYLPGGTRFTVAPRGEGQILKDFRGSIISDLRGQAFSVTQVTIAGRPAIAFAANFTGSTAGGYTFGQMRGVMIEVTDTLSLELNHFTPTGITADFAADDKLFDQILLRVNLSGADKGGTSTSGATLQ